MVFRTTWWSVNKKKHEWWATAQIIFDGLNPIKGGFSFAEWLAILPPVSRCKKEWMYLCFSSASADVPRGACACASTQDNSDNYNCYVTEGEFKHFTVTSHKRLQQIWALILITFKKKIPDLEI